VIPVFIVLTILGLAAGAFSGLFGVGGGVILVPALVFVLGLTQQAAQGTTLAMLVLPVGLLGAIEYARQGCVDFKAVGWLALGFLMGNLLGARLALQLPTGMMEKVFGSLLVIIGLKMIFGF
jgi:uncharacterized membrane protein YfcA